MRESMASVGRFLLAGALLGAASLAQAQMTPAQSLIQDKFVLNLGGFIVGTDVTAHLNGSSSTNPDIDFDQTFGDGSDATRVRADALWRITPNHHLRFLYFNNTHDARAPSTATSSGATIRSTPAPPSSRRPSSRSASWPTNMRSWRTPTSRSRAASAFTT